MLPGMNDSHPTAYDSRSTVTVKEAAAILGISVDAVRSRLHRGDLQGEKVGNTWRVQLPADTPPPDPAVTVGQQSVTVTDSHDRDALVEQLRSENAYLREQLAGTIHQLAAERERADVLQREALGRIETLAAPPRDDPAEVTVRERGHAQRSRLVWWRRLQEHPVAVLIQLGGNGATIAKAVIPVVVLLTGILTRDGLIVLLGALSILTTIPVSIVVRRIEEAMGAGDARRARQIQKNARLLFVASAVFDLALLAVLYFYSEMVLPR